MKTARVFFTSLLFGERTEKRFAYASNKNGLEIVLFMDGYQDEAKSV